MSDLQRIDIVRIKDIPEVHTVEVSYIESYGDSIRKPPGAWKNELFPKVLEGIDRCLKITCEKDRQTNNWIFTAKMHMIHPDELFLTVRNENAKEESRWIPVTERLPEESGYYLITSNSGYVYDVEIRFFFFQHERRTKWKEGFGEVVAWMPLPEPYVEVKNDRHFK